MGLGMKDTEYLNLIKETFPELSIHDFSVIGGGKLAAACLVNKNIIFKVTDSSEKALRDTEHEIYILQRIKQKLSFDVPKILYNGRINNGRWVFGETLLSGITYSKELHDSFDKETKSNILQQVGRIMRELHSIKINDEKGIVFVGDYKNNIAMFHEFFSDDVQKCFSDTDKKHINAICDRYEYLSIHHPVDLVLVHADMHFGNMMFDEKNKKITGLLDFGAAHFSEPSRDMHYYYGDEAKDLLVGYGDNGDPYLSERQKFMSVINFLDTICDDVKYNKSPDENVKKLLNII